MLGAIIGDIAGSRWEFCPTNDYNFELFSDKNDFTDDTICTVAVADALLRGRPFGQSIHEWCRKYPQPMGGYGGRFRSWVMSDQPKPYGSFGNGSAMRVSSVAWFFLNRNAALDAAAESASCTHNHPEGIKGAQAVVLAMHDCRALHRKYDHIGKEEIHEGLHRAIEFAGYNTNLDLRKVQNCFDETCQGTVPVAFWIIAQSNSFEDAIRRAVSLGADADTLGAIVGGIAEVIWEIPEWMKQKAISYLPAEMKAVLQEFNAKISAQLADNEQVTTSSAEYSIPKFTPEHIDKLADCEIFVFGSNLEGKHVGGAARIAHQKFGAVWGQGVGLQGQSYAIPTMQGGVATIQPYVDEFIEFAQHHQELVFLVTRIGCGIAGFSDEEVAPLFREALSVANIVLPQSFVRCLDC